MSVVEPPLIPAPTALIELFIERMQAQYPSFNPAPGSSQYRFVAGLAAICSEVLTLAFNVPEDLIAFVGEVVYQFPKTPAVAASCTSTWTATDTLGHKIPAGTVVLITPEGGGPIAFEVTEEAEVKAGEAKTTAGAVKLRAVEPGPEGNVSGAATAEPNETLAWVESIALVSNPSDGLAEETIEEYKKRVVELARLIKPQPILPEDFANFVRLLVPGIERALAIDELELTANYGNTVEGEGVERCMTVIPLAAEGKSPAMEVLEEAFNKLTAAREASFKSFIGLPTMHPIAVTVKGTFLKGYTEAGVTAAVETALKELLSPAKHGLPPGGDQTGWVNKKVLRYQDVVTALNNVQGFGHYTELKVNGGEADIELTGIAPLPEAGTLTITLTEGSE